MQRTTEERRQNKRYKLDNSVSISSHGVFQLTDISSGGFCFKCPPYTSIAESWETDILTSEVSLEGFPAKRVWVSMTENGTHEFLPTRVGMKFRKLTKKQDSFLLELIESLENKGNAISTVF